SPPIPETFTTSYYVDSVAGDDSNDGLSETSAWKSLAKVVATSFSSQTAVLFKRGDLFRGQLIPSSGATDGYVKYGAYGSGDKPVLLGSVSEGQTSDWLDQGGNIWKSAQAFEIDVGNLIFNGATEFGIKKWNQTDLAAQGDFWFDRSSHFVEVYSA